MNKTIFVAACVLGLLAVVLGAFGAHGLQQLVEAKSVASFETGVRYQMYHACLLFVLGLLPGVTERIKRIVFYLVIGGVALFSFSIYLLAINSLFDFDFKVIAFITPIGGALLIAAWAILGISIYKSK
ncbi:DUF423 domain-containing protein [Maribacter antarcticus]|uniref:DUF423 domain-containing protein n=1 Tax=Maribacter antarcticus TaxID=505250 RepID=UPI00047E5346|nr:DUF423 domain-containing protein [Maribacter antarcticus]